MPGTIGSLLLIAVIGYLWGSLPSGYWMGKLLRGKDYDIRKYGSHKTGATNVLRTLGPVPAAIVFVIDLSKGVGPTLLATFIPIFSGHGWGVLIAGLAALLGHCYPIFINFKGGRGVLTGAGAILVISPLVFLICAITTLVAIAIWRYVSLGSIVGSSSAIICGLLFYFIGQANPTFIEHLSLPQMLYLVIAPTLVIIFHADNISRLLAGNENKFGAKVPTTTNNVLGTEKGQK